MKLKTDKVMTNSTSIVQKQNAFQATAKQILAAVGVGAAAIAALLAAVWGSPLGFFSAVGTGLLLADKIKN